MFFNLDLAARRFTRRIRGFPVRVKYFGEVKV